MRADHRPRRRAQLRGLARRATSAGSSPTRSAAEARSACRKPAAGATGVARLAEWLASGARARARVAAAGERRRNDAGLRLLLVTDAVGGVWVYSLELARALRPLGVETVLAVMGPSPSASAARRGRASLELIDTGLPLDWLDTKPGRDPARRRAIAELANAKARTSSRPAAPRCSPTRDFGSRASRSQHSCVASWWRAVRGTPLPAEFAWRRELVSAGSIAPRPSSRRASRSPRRRSRIYDRAGGGACTTAGDRMSVTRHPARTISSSPRAAVGRGQEHRDARSPLPRAWTCRSRRQDR